VYERILNALGDSKTVVNIGAGTGSYEPHDRPVLAIEPSEVMTSQRDKSLLPAVRATADNLPLHDRSVDAAMTVLSLHHWHPNQHAGIQEMRRVARKRIVIVTIDPRISGRMWLMADYLKEVAALDFETFPLPETICRWLDCPTDIEILPINRNTPDHTLLSFWAHPERVLDPLARAATSGFARQSEGVVQRVVSAIKRDLDNGTWDERYGFLRGLHEFDAGLRLITAMDSTERASLSVC
jgi:SAM-dependent methyltransferase